MAIGEEITFFYKKLTFAFILKLYTNYKPIFIKLKNII